MLVSVIIPYEDSNGALALRQCLRARSQGAQVLLLGNSPPPSEISDALRISDLRGLGSALRAAIPLVSGKVTVFQPPELEVDDYTVLVEPITSDSVDVVVGQPIGTAEGLVGAAVSRLGRLVGGLDTEMASPGLTAVKTSLLRSLELVSNDERFEEELRIKLTARRFRIGVTTALVRATATHRARSFSRASAYLKYGLFWNDANNLHEGYNTLARMDQAPRYNAWLGRKLRPHLGARVLEVGAGIGTITRELLPGRDLIIALEADDFYVDRLRNIFRDESRVRPVHAPVESTDWTALAEERLDSVVLSNVLEHIRDDGLAVGNFRSVLEPGGKLVVLVPALPLLYGTIDRAIGHFRRYTPRTLRTVIESAGFRVDSLEWLNVVGIPGWFLNNHVLRRHSVPPLQLRVYDRFAPLFARVESMFRLPIGLSLLAVSTAV